MLLKDLKKTDPVPISPISIKLLVCQKSVKNLGLLLKFPQNQCYQFCSIFSKNTLKNDCRQTLILIQYESQWEASLRKHITFIFQRRPPLIFIHSSTTIYWRVFEIVILFYTVWILIIYYDIHYLLNRSNIFNYNIYDC